MFSKACEYAIRSSIFIAGQTMKQRRVGLKEVAKAIDSPEAYRSKILQQLTKSKIINSEKGPNGGFMMDKKSLEVIKLSNVVYAIDGDGIYKGCALGLKRCNEKIPCAMHFDFKAIRDQLKLMLETTSIKSLAIEHHEGLTFLKR